MKLTPAQTQALAQKVMDHWKKQNLVTFKADEKVVLEKILQVIRGELQKEMDLDREVNQMLDQLERTNAGEFQRYKMYPILKQKLAKEKKVIL
jgi:hypothetical protein